MNREFLKEAIADAKAVKESAIANAKAALEESFTPQLKTMLAARIEEMEEKEVSETEVKEEMSDPDMRHGESPEDPAEKETEKMRFKEGEDKDDLDEVLAELENELKEDARTDAEEEGYKDGMKDEKEDLKEDERTDAEEEGYKDGMKDEKEDMEDEDIDLDDMSDEDLKDFIEDVIADMVSAGELEAGGDPVEMSDDEEVEVEDDVEVEDEVDVDVDLAEDKRTDAEEEGYKDGIEDAKADMEKKIKDIKAEGTELEEAYATIKTLRSELNEINILNAKLLYSNKIFKAKNLTEAQKVKVLGAFDKAENVKEVKLVFETLKGGLKNTRKPVTENVKIGSASKSSLGKSNTTKKPIVESNEMVNRFKKLAGII
ncbi:MAG: hypothetical protein CMD20_01860 [Flavobacteriales bacterium]|nr:hypothetical protein [Flavobacteriales bacterium]